MAKKVFSQSEMGLGLGSLRGTHSIVVVSRPPHFLFIDTSTNQQKTHQFFMIYEAPLKTQLILIITVMTTNENLKHMFLMCVVQNNY